MLVGVAPPLPPSFPPSGTYIGILLHKQATLGKYFCPECKYLSHDKIHIRQNIPNYSLWAKYMTLDITGMNSKKLRTPILKTCLKFLY